ncbi:MAG: hypothetical protein HFI30_06840 [Lachnospiraceae bacterium]|jgi:hypothetical protein|nr:hypothetical protein [Lachnospiraceae bacterium]
MAENIHLDLSEEMEQDLVSRYGNLCEELTQSLNRMAGEMEGICQKTQYEPMVRVVNQTIMAFNEEIYRVSSQAFEEWCEGEGSFTAAVRNSQAGEEAGETAAQMENHIRNLFEEFWSGHPLGDGLQLSTGRPEVNTEDYEELKKVYETCFQEVETIGEETEAALVTDGEESPTYHLMIPAVRAVAEPVKNAFEQFCVKIDEAKEESERLKQQQDTHNEESAENATNTAMSAADIAEELKMFDDI